MAIGRIHINPEVLKGAIVRAGKTVDDCIRTDIALADWLEGKKRPTFKQLESFSKRYHLPFGYLFLDRLPVEETPIPVFRKGKDARNFNLNVYDTVLLLQKRQDWLSEYLEENEFNPLPYVGAYKGKNTHEIVEALHTLLKIEKDWARHYRDTQNALNTLTERVEDIGILISFNSIVGNNSHRKIDVEECRGFALVNEYAPFIFINSGDSKAAQIFTLIHEMAHILIGFSAGYGIENIWKANNYSEQLCDSIAAEFLVPLELLKKDWEIIPMQFTNIAKIYKVSTLVIARRALDGGLTTKEDFLHFYRSYKANVHIRNSSGGGSFYRTALKRISRTFAIHVNNAVKSNQLLYRDAYMLTGLQGNTFSNLLQSHLNS